MSIDPQPTTARLPPQPASALSRAMPTSISPIASWRHTLILTSVFLVVAVGGAYARARPAAAGAGIPAAPSGPSLYVPVIAAELALIFYVWRGTRSRLATPFATLIGSRWTSVGRFVRDVLVAAALWAVWLGLEMLMSRIFPPAQGAPASMLPHGLLNGSLWVTLSIVAGFAEEIAFRGYFLRQMTALTGRVWIALFLQAGLFSIAHGYEGWSACTKIAMFGLLFGAVALWQRNLRSCIIAHAWTDIAAGLLRI